MIRIAISLPPIIAAVFVGLSGPALAETLTCATSFQGYRVCDDGHSYRSTEWQWQDRAVGEDTDGNRWTTSRWRDGDITTVTRPERCQAMIRIAVTEAAFAAIAATLPLGSMAVEPPINKRGDRYLWLEAAMVDRLGAMRRRAR